MKPPVAESRGLLGCVEGHAMGVLDDMEPLGAATGVAGAPGPPLQGLSVQAMPVAGGLIRLFRAPDHSPAVFRRASDFSLAPS